MVLFFTTLLFAALLHIVSNSVNSDVWLIVWAGAKNKDIILQDDYKHI